MTDSPVVTRFAPSPTGYLHVGGARTALFSWLLARHHGGRFLLRIEDTDLARSTEQATTQLLEDLRWLGLDHDNAKVIHQSRRLDVYNRIIDELMSRGMAYRAYETPEQLDALRAEAERKKQSFTYRKGALPEAEQRRLDSEGCPHVVRFAMPVREYRFDDAVLGKSIVMPADEAQDFVIRKTDGMPTYHFAVVVDDAEMEISHILRGQEHTKNTFYHVALQEALGYARPVYGHLPIILNVDGSKMGKRDRDKKVRHGAHLWLKQGKHTPSDLAAASGLESDRVAAWLDDVQRQLDLPEQAAVMGVIGMSEGDLPEVLVHDFQKNGYLPEVLLNFLALLGWSPGEDRERMSVEEMVRLFSIDGIGKSNARFGRDKLLAFNTEAVAAADAQRLLRGFRDYLAVNPDSPLNQASDSQLSQLLEMKKGFRLFREVDESARFLFIPDDRIAWSAEAIDKVLRKSGGQGLAALRQMRHTLAALGEWTVPNIESAIQSYCESSGLGLGKVAQPLRVAISGGTISPPIFQSLAFLTQASALTRIDRCLRVAAPVSL